MTPFDWKEFYDVGDHLAKHSKKESYQRSAIGRYYYSCFGPVKNYYEKSFRKTLSSNDSHSTLIRILTNSPFLEEQKLGKKLEDLRDNRNFADYRHGKLRKNLVKDSKKDAEEIFLMLDRLYKNPLRLMNKVTLKKDNYYLSASFLIQIIEFNI